MKTFKAGDKVKRIRYHDFNPDLFNDPDRLFTVSHYSDFESSIGLEEDSSYPSYDADSFELVTDSGKRLPPSEDSSINELIEIANKGLVAEYRLINEYHKQVQRAFSRSPSDFHDVTHCDLNHYPIFRRKLGLNIPKEYQVKLANIMEVPMSTIARWVNGGGNPHPRIAQLIFELIEDMKNE